MVFYFSGTGNSAYVATTLANMMGLELSFIPDCEVELLREARERVVFVFPVYSWGVPPMIEDFVKKFPDSFLHSLRINNLSIDCVMVCGDETAMAPEMFIKTLKRANLEVNSIWSVIMPNNYVLLPGFDVDSPDLEKNKLESCQGRILEITIGLTNNRKGIDVVRGSMPKLKTFLVYPLFKRWGIFPKKWHYLPQCIQCGKCARICPLCNVRMEDDYPRWGKRCCSCLACYHICPVHAVAYGNLTKNKGQYFFPIRKILSKRCHN